MFKTYFGEWTTGRLARLPWLGYALGLFGAMMLIGILVGGGAGLMMGMSGDPAEAEARMEDMMGGIGPVVMVLMVILGLVISVASLNINAKRFRDMGLPGGWTLLGVIVVSFVVAALFGETISNLVGLVLLLVMALVPTGAFGGGAGPEPREDRF